MSLSHDPAYSDLSDREMRDLLDATYELDARFDARLAKRDRRNDMQEQQARQDLYPVRRVDVSAPVPVLGHMARGPRDIREGTPVNPKPWENPVYATPVPCTMCGNVIKSVLTSVVVNPEGEKGRVCGKDCYDAYLKDDTAEGLRYRVRYAPSDLHMGPWALIDTSLGDDHVAGRAMTEDFALKWATARNSGEQEPVETPGDEGLAEVRVLRAFVAPPRAVDGGEAA